MIIRAIAIMAAAFLLTGCGKKTGTPPPVAQPPTQQPAAAPGIQQPGTPVPVAPVVTSQTNTNINVEPDLDALSMAVRAWGLQHSGMPKDFAEFAANPNIQIPPPPPGKKYAFDHKKHVILVNR